MLFTKVPTYVYIGLFPLVVHNFYLEKPQFILILDSVKLFKVATTAL